MAIVKIVNGTYGHRPDGSKYVIPVTPADLPISVSDEEAKRIVEMGVAVYVDAGAVATAPADDFDSSPISNSPSDEGGDSGDSDCVEITGTLDPEGLKDWKMDDLKKLAADMGIDTTNLKKKAALIDAICTVEVGIPDEEVPSPDVEDVIG